MSKLNDTIKASQSKTESGPKEQHATLNAAVYREFVQRKRLNVLDRKLETENETFVNQMRHSRKWDLKTEKNILYKEIYRHNSSMDVHRPSLTPSVDEWLSMSSKNRNKIALNHKSNKVFPSSNSNNNSTKKSPNSKENKPAEQSKATLQVKT